MRHSEMWWLPQSDIQECGGCHSETFRNVVVATVRHLEMWWLPQSCHRLLQCWPSVVAAAAMAFRTVTWSGINKADLTSVVVVVTAIDFYICLKKLFISFFLILLF